MMIFFKLLFFIYIIMVFLFLIGWFKNNSQIDKSDYKLSVVIAVRNEEKNILRLIKNLKSQDYDNHQYDVIIIDDHSEDNSWKILVEQASLWSNLRVLKQDPQLSGKKMAILKGVKESNSDIILTTDADCSFNKNWLTTMSSYFKNKKINLVSGPVNYINSNSLFKKIQTLEFLSLIGSAAGAIGINKPILCNGANLAYRKKIFLEINNYESDNIVSGDDVFLLHSVKKRFPNSILFAKNQDAVVLTDAVNNISNFFNQRIRWSAKSIYYKDLDSIFVALIVFLTNLSMIILGISSCFKSEIFNRLILLFLVKNFIDFIFLIPVLLFFNRHDLIKWIFPLQFVYPFYITLISIFSNFIHFNWKGRKRNV